ncbi:MAG: sialidase family protein [Thermosulfidibacteraceae bacterium]|jgi:hypothetical protein
MVTEKLVNKEMFTFFYGQRVDTPFTKCAFISGLPLEFDGLFLVPGFGIPYGCKLTSPLIFEYDADSEQLYLRSIIAISEDEGIELRHTSIVDLSGVLLAFVASSFPVHSIFYSVSLDDGVTWSRPNYSGIDGSLVFAVSKGENILLAVKSEDEIVLWSGKDVSALRPVGFRSCGNVDYSIALRYMEDMVFNRVIKGVF